jgi:uncharacterized protein with LGFP repeats
MAIDRVASPRRRWTAIAVSFLVAIGSTLLAPVAAASSEPIFRATVGAPMAASALSGSQFNAGYIIDDGLFYSSNAMTQPQIQAFLDEKVGTCTNANCLNVLYAKTETRNYDRGICKGYTPDSDALERASMIIYKVQVACGISAKVILVTLQKEQGLVTHKGPTSGRLGAAMGWLCPDTAPCNTSAASFFRQIYGGAWQLKRYNTPDYFGNYHPGTHQILYHPNRDCGTKTVAIRNHATAALYNYTPYTPNAGALANLGGTAPPCGSYGNRNFWVFYSQWFGNPIAGAGANAITEAWAESGGISGPWGNRTSGGSCLTGSTCAHLFENAIAYWTASAGLRVATGVIAEWALPRISTIGYPTSHPVTVAENGGGVAQAFTKGLVNAGPSGTFSMTGVTRTEHGALGGVRGAIGWPISQTMCNLAGGACVTEFQNGYIFEIKGIARSVAEPAIYALYESGNGPSGPLKLPTSSAIPVAANGGGIQQAFNGGLVNVTSAGTFVIQTGAIRTALGSEGGVGAAMGWPTADQICGLPGGGCSQRFQNGAIFVIGGVTKVVSSRLIADYHDAQGGPSGSLGYPVSKTIVMSASQGRVTQSFDKGLVYSSPEGSYTLTGPIRSAHGRLGGVNGPAGWPIGDQVCGLPGGGCSQAFENGVIYAPASGTPRLVLAGPVADYYAANGGPGGQLGYPTSETVRVTKNGGGFAQAFAGGLVNAGPEGAFLEVGVIRSKHAVLGGVAGSIGWPIAEQQCGVLPNGECSQEFQGGTLYTLRSGVTPR